MSVCKNFQDKCEREIWNWLQTTKYIIRYVYDRKGKAGVLLAFKNQDSVWLGWSKCNKKLDKWNRAVALWLAYQRAVPLTLKHIPLEKVPSTMQSDFVQMYWRTRKYFKLDESSVYK